MQLLTTQVWDDRFWNSVENVYVEAFPHGRKNEKIVRRLLNEGEGALHAFVDDAGQVVGMALTAILSPYNALLIDYLGVATAVRGTGLGGKFVGALIGWAKAKGYDGIVLEVESTEQQEADDHQNVRRIQFWKKCGFRLIPYLHDYKVVPELYRAMTFLFHAGAPVPSEGPALFHAMEQYHKKAWSRRL